MDILNVLLFDGFETLDVMGPVEIFGNVNKLKINFVSMSGGIVSSAQGVKIDTVKPLFDKALPSQKKLLLLPGGETARSLLLSASHQMLINKLIGGSSHCLTVCTGALLLAATGKLDNRRATTNKRAFSWISSRYTNVLWDKDARWVKDDGYYTSAGVSAGIDMALKVVTDLYSFREAKEIAQKTEYNWIEEELCRDHFV